MLLKHSVTNVSVSGVFSLKHDGTSGIELVLQIYIRLLSRIMVGVKFGLMPNLDALSLLSS